MKQPAISTTLKRFVQEQIFFLKNLNYSIFFHEDGLTSYAAMATKLTKIRGCYVFHPRGGTEKSRIPPSPGRPFKYSPLITGHFLL